MDLELRGNEFLVAFRLLQHANSDSLAIFPSQDRIALQIGMDPRTVRRCVSGLVTKGWLKYIRPNRQKTNHYVFCQEKINAMGERKKLLDDRSDRKFERSKMSSQPDYDRTHSPGPERTNVSAPDGTMLPSKHLKRTPDRNTLTEGAENRGQQARTDFSDAEVSFHLSSSVAKRTSKSDRNQSGRPAISSRSYVDPVPIFDRIEAETRRRK